LKEKCGRKFIEESCSCTTIPRLTGQLYHRRNWNNCVLKVIITHPILRIWPLRATTCSLDQTKLLHLRFSPTWRSLLRGWTDKFLNIFSGLQEIDSGLRSVLSVVGSMVHKIRVGSLWFFYFLVGLRSYQHTLVFQSFDTIWFVCMQRKFSQTYQFFLTDVAAVASGPPPSLQYLLTRRFYHFDRNL